MKSFLILPFLLCTVLAFAQNNAVTTLTTLVLDEEVPLKNKNKRSHSNQIMLQLSPDIWNQFERIDAVFISAWTGSGPIAKAQYEADAAKIDKEFEACPVIYYAEKDASLFTFPRKNAGYGTELVVMEQSADSLCVRRYNKGRIGPKGIYPCLVTRHFGITPVNHFYRFAVPKQYYSAGKCPSFNLLLRSSSKADTVLLDTKIAFTIQGKRYNAIKTLSMDQFLKEAILEGMKAEAFPLNHARWIVENQDVFFVGKCPICRPVESAIRDYIAAYVQKNSNTPNEIIDGLVKGSKEDKQTAFSKIVSRYVDRYFKETGMNEREITDMQTKLEEGRKLGMNLKSGSFGPFCPSCDGACRVKN